MDCQRTHNETMATRYICSGCSEIHEDSDYNKFDGDILLDEESIECLTNFINKEYERNLKEYPDARRSFEFQQALLNRLKPTRECVKRGKNDE